MLYNEVVSIHGYIIYTESIVKSQPKFNLLVGGFSFYRK